MPKRRISPVILTTTGLFALVAGATAFIWPRLDARQQAGKALADLVVPQVTLYDGDVQADVHDKVRDVMYRLAYDAETVATLQDFVSRGGILIVPPHEQDRGGGSYGLYPTLAIEAGFWEGADAGATVVAHEVAHHRNAVDDILLPYASFKTEQLLQFNFVDFFQLRFTDEADAQVKSIDFAYDQYLEGNAGPLNFLLDQTKRHGYARFISATARAYIAQLHGLTEFPANFKLEDYPEKPDSADLPFSVRKSMAQGAAFSAWFAPESDAVMVYGPMLYDGYRNLVRRVAKHLYLEDVWQTGVTHTQQYGVRDFKFEDAKVKMIINGVSYAPYVSSAILDDDYLRRTMPKSLMQHEADFNRALWDYNSKDIPPMVSLEPDTSPVYDAKVVEAYVQGNHSLNSTLKEYATAQLGSNIQIIKPRVQ